VFLLKAFAKAIRRVFVKICRPNGGMDVGQKKEQGPTLLLEIFFPAIWSPPACCDGTARRARLFG
jgi:hypothetical protein